jgi:hypothetical protein
MHRNKNKSMNCKTSPLGFKIIILILVFLKSFQPVQSHKGKNSLLTESEAVVKSEIRSQPPVRDYYEKNYLRYGDFVYHNNIKSVLFNRQGWELSAPIIEFNSGETLILQFDDLDADYKNYTYTIIHCDALWQPTNLMQFEFIDGFYEDRIEHYAFSRNTRTGFTNYWLEFPNRNMRPKISGNYILKVFVDGNENQVAFTRRFMVFEQNVIVEATVNQATDLNFRATHQEIDFIITTSRLAIANPYRDMKVVITQNGRWDNAITGLQPRMVRGNQFVFDYEQGNLFAGGNEFRNFDIKSLRYRTLNVDNITTVRNSWAVQLMTDRNRQFMRYTSRGDINGRFLIKTDDYQDNVLEADYALVHFYLPYDAPIVDGTVYVFGELTQWATTDFNRMTYNYRDRRYELSLMLKQGFYDYKYAFVKDGQDLADVTVFEGSHSVTENDYTIYVYFRRQGEVYDSLVGIHHINTAIR